MRQPIFQVSIPAYYLAMGIFRSLQRSIFVVLGTVFIAACATKTPRANLERVRDGMDKARVLDAAGNPKRTYHQRGQDHWVYIFFEGERELYQQIDFRDGIVTKVSPVSGKANFTGKLENAESMEDFERTVKAHAQENSDFKDVPEDGKP